MNTEHLALFIYHTLNGPFTAIAAVISGFSIVASLVTMLIEVIPTKGGTSKNVH